MYYRRKKDYSDEKWWQICIGRYASAQSEFPDGIGIDRSIEIKEKYWLKDLYKCPYSIFKIILNNFEKEYEKLCLEDHITKQKKV